MTNTKLRCPSHSKGQILARKAEGPKLVQISEENFLSKNVMRPIKLISGVCGTRRCLCVGGGGRGAKVFSLKGQKWWKMVKK